jgi:hypothetical protein
MVAPSAGGGMTGIGSLGADGGALPSPFSSSSMVFSELGSVVWA